jgi:hypothetical protein
MATKLEQDYLSSWIRPIDSVLEFGPGNCEWARTLPENKFVGIDLYPPESTPPSNMKYIEGNLLDINLNEKFDVVACLSSFEHAGIEQPHFINKCIDLDEHKKVANKLTSLVKNNGLMLLTLPAGNNELYVVDKNGNSDLYQGGEDFLWGFRTFTLEGIKNLFPTLNFRDYKTYLCKPDSDYFDTDSWEKVQSDLLINSVYKKQNGLLCVAFQKYDI